MKPIRGKTWYERFKEAFKFATIAFIAVFFLTLIYFNFTAIFVDNDEDYCSLVTSTEDVLFISPIHDELIDSAHEHFSDIVRGNIHVYYSGTRGIAILNYSNLDEIISYDCQYEGTARYNQVFIPFTVNYHIDYAELKAWRDNPKK